MAPRRPFEQNPGERKDAPKWTSTGSVSRRGDGQKSSNHAGRAFPRGSGLDFTQRFRSHPHPKSRIRQKRVEPVAKGLAAHWFEDFTKTWSAVAPTARARTTAWGMPPAIDMCAPSRGPIIGLPEPGARRARRAFPRARREVPECRGEKSRSRIEWGRPGPTRVTAP